MRFQLVPDLPEFGTLTAALPDEEAPPPGDDEEGDAPAVEEPDEEAGLLRWVLTVEDAWTGDGRIYTAGAFTWRDLPLPFMAVDKTTEGHLEARLVAQIVKVERDGNRILGWTKNVESDDPEVVRLQKLMADGALRGVSVDMDNLEGTMIFEAEEEVEEPAPGEDVEMSLSMPKMRFTAARIMGATAVPFPAFMEARQEVEDLVAAFLPGRMSTVCAGGTPWTAEAALTAASGTGVVVVAVPAVPEEWVVEGGLPADELHVTLGYFGDIGDLTDETLAALRTFVDDNSTTFGALAGGIARLGNDDPQAVAVLVESPMLQDLRTALEAAAPVDLSHPHFTPHMTLGYGVDMPDAPALPEMDFVGLELWAGDEVYSPESAVVASITAPDDPPAFWFEDPQLPGPFALTVLDSGRIVGHLATWNSCHTGFTDRCVRPPRSAANYEHFHTGTLVTAEGTRVRVGQITTDSGHASMSSSASTAKEHYDHTGWAAADIRCGEDEHGIWIAGAVRPGLDVARLRRFMAADVSGDWRKWAGQSSLELIGICSVNVPGFPKVQAHYTEGEITSMVASFQVCDTAPSTDWKRAAADRIAASVGLSREQKRAQADRLAERLGLHRSQRLAVLAERVRG